MNLKVYGCRGSIPMSRSLRTTYGGNTSSMVLESKGDHLILDAGSGILLMEYEHREIYEDYPMTVPFSPNILLSHVHLDHIVGLAAFTPVFVEKTGTKIYTASRDSRPLKEQIFGAFAPPYWPVTMADMAKVECFEIFDNKPFNIGVFTVTPFRATHPNATQSFHITDGGKTIVYLLDNEHKLMNNYEYDRQISYCKNADLVIFDGAYAISDYEAKRGFGHSTVTDGIELAKNSGCKRMLMSHFAPNYKDSELDDLIKYLIPHGYGSRFLLASDGLTLVV